MRTSVIVSTYNAVRALDLVLCGLARQTRAPDEIWIADDGSTPETAALVGSYEERFGGRLHHVWQSDRGHRRGRIANEAVRRSTGEFLIFLDGDSIPHSRWVEDHVAAAVPDTVLCGRRVKLGSELSAALAKSWIESGRLESRRFVVRAGLAGSIERWQLGIRWPAAVSRAFYRRPRRLMGVNFGLPRSVFEAVNGFEEDNPRGRRDDRELEFRIIRNGFARVPLLYRAIVYHLDHGKPTQDEASRLWLAERERSDDRRARVGLDSHGAFDPDA